MTYLKTFRLERLDHLAQKFKLKCDTHEAWANGQDDYLKSDDITGASLATLLVNNNKISTKYLSLNSCFVTFIRKII